MQGSIDLDANVLAKASCVPDWEDINDIIADLQRVLDAMSEKDNVNANMRASIARAIAQMREEKVLETSIDRLKEIVHSLEPFTFKAAGVCKEAMDY